MARCTTRSCGRNFQALNALCMGNYRPPSSITYEPEALAFFELVSDLSTPIKNAYNNLWVNYRAVMEEHDLFMWNLTLDEPTKMVSVVTPYGEQTKIGSPVFTSFGGITGASASAYNMPSYVPSTNGVNYQLTDCGFWVYNQSTLLQDSAALIGCGVLGEGGMLTCSFNNNPAFKGAINGYNSITYDNTGVSRHGLWHVSRTGTTVKVYRNGVEVYSATLNNVAIANQSYYELANNLGGVLTAPYIGRTILASGVCSGSVNPVNLYEAVKDMIGDMPLYKFYGDSIFAGYGFSNPETESIPAQLCALTDDKYALNWGISGTTIKNLYDSGVPIERCNNSSDIVFFDYIINDAVGSLNTTTYGNNYRSKIEEAIAGGATRVVLIIPYVTDSAVTSVWSPYVTIVQTIAGEYPETELIDLRSSPYTLSDGTHPTTAGAAAAAALIFAQL